MRDHRRRPAHVLLALTSGMALAVSGVTVSPAAATPAPPRLAPVGPGVAADLGALPLITPYAVFVNVRGGTAETRAALVADHGLEVSKDFPSVGAVYAYGTLGAVATLRSDPAVTYLSASRALTLQDDSSGWATRVEQVQRSIGNGPYRDSAGHILDGTGVGVAVVDSGIDGTHPDLATRIVRNTKFKCSTPVLQNTTTHLCFGPVVAQPAVDTDPSSGHGSHVAGIVAGDGTASKGTFHGVAQGASLYGYATGDGDSIFNFDVAAAYQDILDTNAAGTNTPRIRIATNSWGNAAGSAYDPNDIISQLTRALVANGVTVLFAAGNGDTTNVGGTGADDRLSSTAKDPTPGVITVANYDDAGTGTRDGVLDSSSSRGFRGHPNDYPDISAPGALITSTCRAFQPICGGLGETPEWAPYYSVLSGTSMATPHVAGLAAILYQAKPSLTPTAVEQLLQDTAYKFGAASTYEADPQNPAGTTSFDKGAGLADLQAALDAIGAAHDGGDPAQGAPSVAITSPADGITSDAKAALSVTGTATDGYVAPRPLLTQTIAAGDGGDLTAPTTGSADLVSVTAREGSVPSRTNAAVVVPGMTYTIAVRDLADRSPVYNTLLKLHQTIGGVAYESDLTWNGTTLVAAAPTATVNAPAVVAAGAVNVAANTLTFSVNFSDLGNPAPLSPAIKVYVQSYNGLSLDLAPGGIALSTLNAPEYGSFEIRRPSVTGPPATTVTLAVDGAAAQAVPLSGASPAYTWTTAIDPTTLVDGPHTATATVLTNGVVRSTRTLAFSVQRPVVVVNSVAITSPAEGSTLDRGPVTMSGTSSSNAPVAKVRSVVVQITGTGFDSGVLTADGTDTWSLPFDVGQLAGGGYTISVQLLLDGVSAATVTRSVLVPAAPVLVSCQPKALSFWKNQFNGSKKAVYLSAEANALADKGAALSGGYFSNGTALVNVLYVGGKLPAETAAARQYAPLLLNLAAGQLSASMTLPAGLSGAELLDPSVYDPAKLGTKVSTAATWIRGQFSTGDLGGAEQAAINLNTRVGLTC